jgi:hypothetical protein
VACRVILRTNLFFEWYDAIIPSRQNSWFQMLFSSNTAAWWWLFPWHHVPLIVSCVRPGRILGSIIPTSDSLASPIDSLSHSRSPKPLENPMLSQSFHHTAWEEISKTSAMTPTLTSPSLWFQSCPLRPEWPMPFKLIGIPWKWPGKVWLSSIKWDPHAFFWGQWLFTTDLRLQQAEQRFTPLSETSPLASPTSRDPPEIVNVHLHFVIGNARKNCAKVAKDSLPLNLLGCGGNEFSWKQLVTFAPKVIERSLSAFEQCTFSQFTSIQCCSPCHQSSADGVTCLLPKFGPSDFFFSVFLRQQLQGLYFPDRETLKRAICRTFSEINWAVLVYVFLDWIERLHWVIENGWDDHYS